MGGVYQQIINLQTELNYLNKFKIYSIFSYMTWPYPLTHILTHPSTQPPIHPPMGGVYQQIINLQRELNYLD